VVLYKYLEAKEKNPVNILSSYNESDFDTLSNSFEGPFFPFKEEWQMYYEATKLFPTRPCTLKTLIYNFGNFTDTDLSKNCEFYIWEDNNGVPGQTILSFEHQIALEADWYGWIPLDVSDRNIVLNEVFWMGHYEKSAGYPTSRADSVYTPTTNYYSQDGVSWTEDLWDYMHKAVVSYSDTLSEYQAIGNMTVVNRGNDDLIVSDIISSETWVTDISVKMFTIAPGDSKNVIIVVDAEELNDGDYHGNLTIFSNDPESPEYVEPTVFYVHKQLVPDIHVTPDTLFFIKTDDPSSSITIAELKVENYGEGDLTISSISADVPWVTNISHTELSVKPYEEKLVYVSVTQDQNMFDGSYIGNIEIQCNDLDTPIYRVSLVFDIQTSIEAQDLLETEIPADFALYPNYPNPFNPMTTIKFSIPKPTHVTLKVYDISGHEVLFLLNEKMSAGWYRVAFDASQLTSGVYLYTLQTNGFSDTKKCLLIK
jgi:hypothetical protein